MTEEETIRPENVGSAEDVLGNQSPGPGMEKNPEGTAEQQRPGAAAAAVAAKPESAGPGDVDSGSGDPPIDPPPGGATRPCLSIQTVNRGHGNIRALTIAKESCLDVYAVDEPAFGANHAYDVVFQSKDSDAVVMANIDFQKGPVKEQGHNGIQNEDLLAIVIDRLQCLQRGDFPCPENVVAAKSCMSALAALNSRRRDRQNRGVDGTSQA